MAAKKKDENTPASGGDGASNGKSNGFQPAERVPVRKAYKLYIGGAFVRSESGRYTQVAEAPGSSTKENVSRASRKDGRDAVKVAQAAWEGWNGRTAFNRGQILYRLGEMMESRKSS